MVSQSQKLENEEPASRSFILVKKARHGQTWSIVVNMANRGQT